ncbi:hypothetical protein L596_025815 [Steinernema carpocapsae]|uniref:Uncharacterized protein n=1 Tax=Steinernema carpocapsae TaxID=34508 RepID=A0A4U5M8V3_STECR|nr:hypothetical protein L596_025815 [Steinernema carpocapsae]
MSENDLKKALLFRGVAPGVPSKIKLQWDCLRLCIPLYYYVTDMGQMSFLQISEAGTELEENKNHIVNN